MCRAAAFVEACFYYLLMTRLYTTEQVICIRARLSVAVSAIFPIMFSVTTSIDTVLQLCAIGFFGDFLCYFGNVYRDENVLYMWIVCR